MSCVAPLVLAAVVSVAMSAAPPPIHCDPSAKPPCVLEAPHYSVSQENHLGKLLSSDVRCILCAVCHSQREVPGRGCLPSEWCMPRGTDTAACPTDTPHADADADTDTDTDTAAAIAWRRVLVGNLAQ